jgi:hypothetical protein
MAVASLRCPMAKTIRQAVVGKTHPIGREGRWLTASKKRSSSAPTRSGSVTGVRRASRMNTGPGRVRRSRRKPGLRRIAPGGPWHLLARTRKPPVTASVRHRSDRRVLMPCATLRVARGTRPTRVRMSSFQRAIPGVLIEILRDLTRRSGEGWPCAGQVSDLSNLCFFEPSGEPVNHAASRRQRSVLDQGQTPWFRRLDHEAHDRGTCGGLERSP